MWYKWPFIVFAVLCKWNIFRVLTFFPFIRIVICYYSLHGFLFLSLLISYCKLSKNIALLNSTSKQPSTLAHNVNKYNKTATLINTNKLKDNHIFLSSEKNIQTFDTLRSADRWQSFTIEAESDNGLLTKNENVYIFIFKLLLLLSQNEIIPLKRHFHKFFSFSSFYIVPFDFQLTEN